MSTGTHMRTQTRAGRKQLRDNGGDEEVLVDLPSKVTVAYISSSKRPRIVSSPTTPSGAGPSVNSKKKFKTNSNSRGRSESNATATKRVVETESSEPNQELQALSVTDSCTRCQKLEITCLLPVPPHEDHVITTGHAEQRLCCVPCGQLDNRPSCLWPSLLRDSSTYSRLQTGLKKLQSLIESLPRGSALKDSYMAEITKCIEAEKRFDKGTHDTRRSWGVIEANEVDEDDMTKMVGTLL